MKHFTNDFMNMPHDYQISCRLQDLIACYGKDRVLSAYEGYLVPYELERHITNLRACYGPQAVKAMVSIILLGKAS
jgi:hypothetical protein